MFNPQYPPYQRHNPEMTKITENYRILGQNPIKEKIAYLSNINKAQSTVPPCQRHNPEMTQITGKDQTLGQNPIKAGLIQDKIAYLSDINNARPTVPPYQSLNPEITQITEFLDKTLSKQGLYKTKSRVFQTLRMPNPQYPLTKALTLKLLPSTQNPHTKPLTLTTLRHLKKTVFLLKTLFKKGVYKIR